MQGGDSVTLQDLGLYIGGGSGLLVIIMTMVQIAPIKCNPWTYLARKFGRAINGDFSDKIDMLNDKIDRLENNIEKLRSECDEREATLCRAHRLRFGDEVLHGTKHSFESFQNILLDIDKYENYCATHPLYMNNLAEVTIDLIKKTYKECFDQKNFL